MEAFVYLTVVLGLVLAALFVRWKFLSFGGQRPNEYLGLGPDFDPRTHLSGKMICDGAIFGPTGRMTSRFRGEVHGTWTGQAGFIALDFMFDGGAAQHREWHLRLSDTGLIEAEAEDTEGVGKGSIVGPVMQMQYTIVLPQDAGGHKLKVVDWMYLTEAGTILNRSQFRKGGLLVAELIATIRPD
ncbi:DUF3833 family protein [Palleronia abyssalis]|uniref:DUF3833 domain-containing protein n=1 Tax=Palleronia abyssalis TaxID=1501240 RepID=A0A2R8BT80_9RHOB|nr:DUF3833 family protein [Palleronia abyssalis]SPJ23379.1 hypothetical protein PAA8504_01189 [Palleronia abyssalis]